MIGTALLGGSQEFGHDMGLADGRADSSSKKIHVLIFKMALDFYFHSKKTGKTESFKVKGSDLHLFEKSFSDLQKDTGVFIDPYGKCKIYPDHLKIIIKTLEGKSSDIVSEFVDFLKLVVEQQEVLIADGD
ncbi:hypothetical protein [Paracidovorax avenae]|uniref:hypothetical protein n=1 Tax=Paracidovorax avenae TaxID=80867 RepID=UPI0012FDAC40|nr:hypothetical protein [Paracidovorax avenae]